MAIATRFPLSAGSPLLSVRDLAVTFGAIRALDGVDLDIHQGEVVALAGENGAGKSTLVRCIAGDMTPTSGQIQLAGQPLPSAPAAVARRGVAVVWQDLAHCDNLDVASNLLLGREGARLLLSESRFHAKAARLLGELGIPLTDTTQSVQTLSGGQRQLLAVARAMRDRPHVLILDEPTAALGVQESAQVEELTTNLSRQGTTILLISHDIEQMFRLADRIVVLRHGRKVGELETATAHPDDVVAVISGQEVDSSARRQLTRLHGLVDRLSSAEPSSSLSLILSALAAALHAERLCVHLVEGSTLRLGTSLGLPSALAVAWTELPAGPAGGPPGRAATTEATAVDVDVQVSESWRPYARLAGHARIGSSWAAPVMGSTGLMGVITVLRPGLGGPQRDELDLMTLYAGYAASAIERDRLLGEVTARNQVLETIREVLETLAGPVPLHQGLVVALAALREGLGADRIGLLGLDPEGKLHCRGFVDVGGSGPICPLDVETDALRALDAADKDGTAHAGSGPDQGSHLSVRFSTPSGPYVVIADWSAQPGPSEGGPPSDATALLEDAAHSLHLALEREESDRAQRAASALRRTQELQQGFLSRLSHELRTPLTAIRGYASSLMQSDVTWDGESQERFLSRIAAESARLGRLVDDLLDFSAIEADLLRMHRDWCDLQLVFDAAAACLPPASNPAITIACHPDLPVVWADHDRLEQVLVNLLDNAVRHNPPGTLVTLQAVPSGPADVVITVADDGPGAPQDFAGNPFEPRRQRRSPSAGAGLGLSIAKGIIDAHGGRIRVAPRPIGTCFEITLPTDVGDTDARDGDASDGDPSGDGDPATHERFHHD